MVIASIKTPYCHGEKMQRTYRFKGSDGKIYVIYQCNHCSNREVREVE